MEADCSTKDSRIAAAVLDQYRRLGNKGKPQPHEFTCLAGIVLETRSGELHPITLATGLKCLGGPSSDDHQLRDCHAEVLARRTFVLLLLLDMRRLLNEQSKQVDGIIQNAARDSLGCNVRQQYGATESPEQARARGIRHVVDGVSNKANKQVDNGLGNLSQQTAGGSLSCVTAVVQPREVSRMEQNRTLVGQQHIAISSAYERAESDKRVVRQQRESEQSNDQQTGRHDHQQAEVDESRKSAAASQLDSAEQHQVSNAAKFQARWPRQPDVTGVEDKCRSKFQAQMKDSNPQPKRQKISDNRHGSVQEPSSQREYDVRERNLIGLKPRCKVCRLNKDQFQEPPKMACDAAAIPVQALVGPKVVVSSTGVAPPGLAGSVLATVEPKSFAVAAASSAPTLTAAQPRAATQENTAIQKQREAAVHPAAIVSPDSSAQHKDHSQLAATLQPAVGPANDSQLSYTLQQTVTQLQQDHISVVRQSLTASQSTPPTGQLDVGMEPTWKAANSRPHQIGVETAANPTEDEQKLQKPPLELQIPSVRILELLGDGTFRMASGCRLHMYVSQAPCGDCCVVTWQKEELKRCGWVDDVRLRCTTGCLGKHVKFPNCKSRYGVRL